MENKGYTKFLGSNKVYYGRCANGDLLMFTRARMKLAPLCDIHFLLLLHQPIASHSIFLFYCVLFNLTL